MTAFASSCLFVRPVSQSAKRQQYNLCWWLRFSRDNFQRQMAVFCFRLREDVNWKKKLDDYRNYCNGGGWRRGVSAPLSLRKTLSKIPFVLKCDVSLFSFIFTLPPQNCIFRWIFAHFSGLDVSLPNDSNYLLVI